MDQSTTEALLAVAAEAARKAGSILSEVYRTAPGVRGTEGKDIKTEADVAAEQAIRQILGPTGLPILGEEEGWSGETSGDGPCWVVDPLDGTFNFVRGLPFCGVSLALWQGGEPILGTIYDLTDGSLLEGICGGEARCDGQIVEVSSVTSNAQAVLATGFPNQRDYRPEALQKSIRGFQQFKKIRMLGSAALALAQVVRGRIDAYWEEDIWWWDVAAGLALVRAAGGAYTMLPGTRPGQFHVFAHNGHLRLD